MLDSKYFGEKIDVLVAALEKRNADTSLVSEIKARSEKRKKAILEVEQLKAKRNQASAEIAAMKKSGQNADARVAEMRGVGDQIKKLDQDLTQIEEDFKGLALSLPNLPHSSVPSGRDANENVEVRAW